MIRRLEDMTGVNAQNIPLDDKSVMSLFHGTEVLGITPEQIGGTKLGSSRDTGIRNRFRYSDAFGHKSSELFGSRAVFQDCPTVQMYGSAMLRN